MITGVILARNEEANIVACLEPFRPHVGELFLIDSGSSSLGFTMATTHYLWDRLENNVIGEFDGSGNVVASYVTKPNLFGDVMNQRRADSGARYYHNDSLGTVTELTDQGGIVTDTFRATAFGENVVSTGATTSPYKYIGAKGYYVDTGLDSLAVRRRRYSPSMSRWLSVDPLSHDTFIESQTTSAPEFRQFSGQADSERRSLHSSEWDVQRWIYCDNNPLANIDPSGMATLSVKRYASLQAVVSSARATTCVVDAATRMYCIACSFPCYLGSHNHTNSLGYDDENDEDGGNAYKHCIFSCCTVALCGNICISKWLDWRENPGEVTGQMDLANNSLGYSHAPGRIPLALGPDAISAWCAAACYADWVSGRFTCWVRKKGKRTIIPCPPPEKREDATLYR